jgi:hypothetical protein
MKNGDDELTDLGPFVVGPLGDGSPPYSDKVRGGVRVHDRVAGLGLVPEVLQPRSSGEERSARMV